VLVAGAVLVDVDSAAIVLVAIVLVAIVLVAIMLVDMNRPKTVIVVGEAMCGTGAVAEGKSGNRRQYAKQVEEGERTRHPEPCCPGQPNEHQSLPPTPGNVVPGHHSGYMS
jgi:hypothetical protein